MNYQELKQKCIELPERKTLDDLQTKKLEIQAKLNQARNEISSTLDQIKTLEAEIVARMVDGKHPVLNLRKELDTLRQDTEFKQLMAGKFESEVLPTLEAELRTATVAHEKAVQAIIVEAQNEASKQAGNALIALFEMYAEWAEAIANIGRETRVNLYPNDKQRLKTEATLREKLDKEQRRTFEKVSEQIIEDVKMSNRLIPGGALGVEVKPKPTVEVKPACTIGTTYNPRVGKNGLTVNGTPSNEGAIAEAHENESEFFMTR